MRPLSFIFLVAAVGCQPDLPQGPSTAPPADDVRVTLEPPAPLDHALRVVRIRLGADAALDPARVLFVRGELTPVHLRELQRDEVSHALGERRVPTKIWRDDAGGLVVAPTIALEAGASYGLAYADPPLLATLRVDDDDTRPLLVRRWPLPGTVASAPFAIWCGDAPLSRVDVAAVLAPDGPAGALLAGAATGATTRCVRFAATDGASEAGSWVPPPAVAFDSGNVLLDPTPIDVGAERIAPATPPVCADDEDTFGLGCVEVQDDRLLGRSADAPLFWAVRELDGMGEAVDVAFTTDPSGPFVVAPVRPRTTIVLDVVAVDLAARVARTTFVGTTRAPMAHPILNEMLANPLGLEPNQEWIEIVNDGSVAAELGEYAIDDLGGHTVLPSASLAPKAFALVVNEQFVADDGVDAAPPAGTLLLHVPKLGKNGLTNAGEPINLVASHGGRILSRIPAVPEPKAGRSVARRQPSAPDGAASSFTLSMPTPGRDNGEGLP